MLFAEESCGMEVLPETFFHYSMDRVHSQKSNSIFKIKLPNQFILGRCATDGRPMTEDRLYNPVRNSNILRPRSSVSGRRPLAVLGINSTCPVRERSEHNAVV